MSYDSPQIGQFRRPYVGAIGNNCKVPMSYLTGTSTSQWMSRSRHRAAVAWNTAAQVRIGLPLFLISSTWAETNFYGKSTKYTLAVEYGGATVAQATFGGSTTFTGPTAGVIDIAFTDPLVFSATVPVGAFAFIRIWGSNPNIIPSFANGSLSTDTDTTNGESFLYVLNGTTPDLTMSTGTIGTPTDTTSFAPCAIIGLTTKPSVAINGDSISSGLYDSYTGTYGSTTGDMGIVARSLGAANIAYHNLAVSGEAASNYIAASVCREFIASFCSHRIIQYGINDLNRLSGLESVLRQNIVAIRNLTPTKPTFLTTMTPFTGSSDSWASQGNQTFSGLFTGSGYDPRQENNNWRRSVPPEFAGCFDMASVVEQGSTGKWQTGLGGGALTSEGLHPNSYGESLLLASGTLATAVIQ